MSVKLEERPKSTILPVRFVECLDWDCADALAGQGSCAAVLWVKEEDIKTAKRLLKAA